MPNGKRLELHWQILIALGLALLAGMLTSRAPAHWQSTLLTAYTFVGGLFVNALKMLIVPLIFASIINGVIKSGGGRGFGRLGFKTLALYMLTTTLAALLGLLMINAFQPGIIDGEPAAARLALSEGTTEKLSSIGERGLSDLTDVFVSMVPPNIVQAAADGQMLGIITFSLLIGFFITQLSQSRRELFSEFAEGFFEVMLMITHLVMRFAPLGVFALVAKVAATTGLSALLPLAKFLAAVFSGLGIHLFVTIPLLILLLGRLNPLRLFRAMAPAMLTAFSTSSSAATLPVTMDCVENRAGVSNRVSSFVLPLGATVNMDGTALFEVVAALFIAQAYGLELSFGTQAMVAVLAIVTSIGVAAVPSASMVAIVLILGTLGLPAEGIGLVLAVDRLPDMCRTVVNIFGDSSCAALVAKSEGEEVLVAA